MATDSIAPAINCPAPNLRAGAQGLARVAVDDTHALLLATFEIPVTQAYLLDPRSYNLTGGARIFPRILDAKLASAMSPPAGDNRTVVLALDQVGDFSIYTLTAAGPDLDPFFSSRKLRFRIACDDRFDCRPAATPPPPAPEIAV